MSRRADLSAYRYATIQGYVVKPSRRSFAAHLWRAHCAAHDQPAIVVERFVSLADVEVELPAGRAFTPPGLAAIEAAFRAHGAHPLAGVRRVYSYWPRIPIATAERLAAALWSIATSTWATTTAPSEAAA